jgi:cytochrome b subunit of formate dehydrogenase
MSRAQTVTREQKYPRFTRAQRIEHVVAIASFTVLALTGLPQKYAATGIGEAFIGLLGGIEAVRVIHRVAAVVLMGETIYHIVSVGYRVLVRRVRMTMLPTLKDATDAWQAFRYNLGLSKTEPQTGRYHFGEKAEYWAFVWGTIVMVITGFLLWNPIASTRLLPGQFIPAAKAAHGGEAVLAVLAIIIWHFYHVHIRSFNKSMFTGYMTEKEMLHEHPQELADIKAGVAANPVPPPVIQQRRRVYLPVAGAVTAAMLFGLYQFITFEETAIATVDREVPGEAFIPLTATPLPTPLPSATPLALLPYWQGNLEEVLAQRCTHCHGTAAGLDLSTYATALQGSDNGPIIVPGNPGGSLIVEKMGKPHPGRLTGFELDVLMQWISAGAPESP